MEASHSGQLQQVANLYQNFWFVGSNPTASASTRSLLKDELYTKKFRMQNYATRPTHFVRRHPSTKKPQNYKEVAIDVRLILEEASKQGISWRLVPDSEIIELTWNNQKKYFRSTRPVSTSPAQNICIDKAATNQFLREAGINASHGFVINVDDSDDYISHVFESIQSPVVVKLTHNSHGDGVIVGVDSAQKCIACVRELYTSPHYKKESSVLIEQMFFGKEFRIVATRDKVLGIMHRIPANVVGDGKQTIKELIDEKNAQPIRNIDHLLYPHITWDAEMAEIVKEQGMDEASVPAEGQKVILRKVSNVMAGGDAIDYTDKVHESVKELALQTIRAIPGLEFGGIDFMTTDEASPQTKESYTIIEINGSPEFAMHDVPMVGTPRNICGEFLCLLFPELRNVY